MHAPLYFLLVLVLFLLLQLLLLCQQFLLPLEPCALQRVHSLGSEPASNAALNVKCRLFPFLSPHCTTEVSFWEHYFIVPAVDVQTSLLHLAALFTHHVCRFGLVLVRLNKTLVLIGMVVCDLISLSKCVMVCDSWTIVSKAAKIRFWTLLLLNVDSHYLDLVVWKSNFDFKLVWHHKFICFDRVVVILLLLHLLLFV